MWNFRILLASSVLLQLAGPSTARDFPVKIAAARIGLPPSGRAADRDDSGPSAHIAKFACWAPVYVDLEIAAPVGEAAELVIESADPDEIATTYTVPLDLGGKDGRLALADLGKLGYLRPGGVGEATLTIRAANGGKALSEPFRVRSVRPRDPLTYVVLALGGPLTGLELPRPPGVSAELAGELRGGRVELTAITEPARLPDQWFGYDCADVIVLHTGRGAAGLVDKLFGDAAGDLEKRKRTALIEWIRRGGRIVIALGENAKVLSRWPGLQELLPFDVKESREYEKLALFWGARESSQTSIFSGALAARDGGKLPVANLAARPGRAGRVLIPPPGRGEKNEIIAGQSSFGLGKVTLIGFDLDQPAFADFPQRPEFWDWVLREGGANRASAGSEGRPKPGGNGLTEDEDDLAVAIRTHADTFGGVPVVSFGWVALLIVLYILLIGPIEYFFLKRILGRLELTWITFPIIVLTVSLAAYLTAYALKGRELKINKVDVVDIDPASGRIYGTTWFTIFSPRIDNYTLGVTPGEGWSPETDPAGTTVTWTGAPRGGRASLLRRGYRYHADAGGLEKVPVQVWSTKSFVANWSATIERDRFDPKPADAASAERDRLHHPKDPELAAGVTGSFVNRLPVPALTDCVAFYEGKAYPVPGGTIHAGDTVRFVFDGGLQATDWLKKESKLYALRGGARTVVDRPAVGKAGGPQAATTAAGGPLPLLGLLFHEASLGFSESDIPVNASTRRLDQSWRLTSDNRHEVILVGRAAPPAGPAETTLGGADSPTRLWIKNLPGAGERTPTPGTGRQETWVRIYLPVR